MTELDSDLEALSDLLHSLKTHDSRQRLCCPTSSDLFCSEYNEIKGSLQSNIAFISNKSQSLERELFSLKAKEQSLEREKESKLRPLKESLSKQEEEKYALLQQKERIEAELKSINQNLSKTDMFIETTNERIASLEKAFKPKTSTLFDSMTGHQFEIASYQQECGLYSKLLQIVDESYNLLSSWSQNRLQTDNDQRNELETNYINHLALYLEKICAANMTVINRVESLKQHIDSIQRTNESMNKYYGQQRHIDSLSIIKKYRKSILCDEETNKNIKRDILDHIDRAIHIISPSLFHKFMNHITNQQHIAKVVDLSKYKQFQKQPQSQPLSHPQSHPQPPSKPVPKPRGNVSRSSASTQTQINGHHINASSSNKKAPTQKRIKPPMTTSSNISSSIPSQNQNQNDSKPQAQRGAIKPPRPHYQQQPRRGPVRSNMNHPQFRQY